MSDQHILTPGGYRDPKRLHRVRNGQAIRRHGGELHILSRNRTKIVRRIVPAALAPVEAAGTGWRAYAGWTNTSGQPVSRLQADFVVPPLPIDPGAQTIFLFPGLQSTADNSGILQPVLQWGASAIGGVGSWAVASWYVPTEGEALYSDQLVPVAPGQKLRGVITLKAVDESGYSYYCGFDGITGTDLLVERIEELTWCNIALEAYDVSSRDQYPDIAATSFTNIVVTAGGNLGALAWEPRHGHGEFGETAMVVNRQANGGIINIAY